MQQQNANWQIEWTVAILDVGVWRVGSEARIGLLDIMSLYHDEC